MPDNVTAPGTGETFATDQIGSVHYPKTKLVYGANETATDVTAAAGYPVALDAPTLAALENTTVTVGAPLPAGSNTIGTVALDAASLAALETITAIVNALPTIGTTTRSYNLTNAIRVATGATSTAEAALPTMGLTREIRFAASARCWIKWGATGLSAAAAEAASLVLEANAPEVLQIPAGATHFRIIRDTADGFCLMTPVA